MIYFKKDMYIGNMHITPHAYRGNVSSHIECGSYFFDVVRVLLFSFTCLSPYLQSNSNNNSNCRWFLLLFHYIQVSKSLFTNYCWF